MDWVSNFINCQNHRILPGRTWGYYNPLEILRTFDNLLLTINHKPLLFDFWKTSSISLSLSFLNLLTCPLVVLFPAFPSFMIPEVTSCFAFPSVFPWTTASSFSHPCICHTLFPPEHHAWGPKTRKQPAEAASSLQLNLTKIRVVFPTVLTYICS